MPGCRLGPRGIRAASSNVAWDGGPWYWEFDPFEKLLMVDYGVCSFDLGFPLDVYDNIYNEAKSILNSDAFLLTMGGDHSITEPVLKAMAEQHGPISLIQIDAHSDTWEENSRRLDHGSMFYQASKEGILDAKRSIQAGLRTHNAKSHGFNILTTEFVHEQGVETTIKKIKEVARDRVVYLTFDIDALDPAFAPGTGTPVCGGLTTWQAISLIRKLSGINLIGADLVEVSPPYDNAEITALAGATLLLEMSCLIASQK